MKIPTHKIANVPVLLVAAMVGASLFLSLILVPRSGLFRPASAQVGTGLLPSGTLVRAEGQSKVYVIESGVRRWIDSPETIRIQGLSWSSLVTVSASELARYPEGDRLTASSILVLPGESDLLPDLAPFPAEDVRLVEEDGRLVLRFTTAFWNMGGSVFELAATGTPSGNQDENIETVQRIRRADGSVREKVVGNFMWHAPHHHYHYEQFADYSLELVTPTSDPSAVTTAVTQKTTFCMRDDRLVDQNLPGSPAGRVFSACGKIRQGVSVGWADVYKSTLPDQFIDVQDMPAGVYRLEFNVDPDGRFVEKRTGNNRSVAFLQLDPANRTLSVLSTGAAFSTGSNRFPDGMLVRGESDSAVYRIHGGKRHLLRSEAVFNSYGFSWDDVRWVPQGVVNTIPRVTLVQEAGRTHVVNDRGFRRQILNPDVFASYGFSDADAIEVNATDLASIPETDLIMEEGDDRVYSIRDGFVGTFGALRSLGLDPNTVHLVNATDFNAYAVQVMATGLNVPWDVAFLPDGDVLVSERAGTLRRLGNNHPASISVPVRAGGEGGLMAITLHPDFAKNSLVYLYFTSSDGGTKNRVVRYRLEADRLVQDRIIIDDIPSAIYHDGGGMAFGPDGMLYLTTGDANNPDSAQDLSSLAGKTLRLTADGGIPSDNPFGTYVWSYGHRNAQGITWDAQGRMWQTEHGRSGAASGFDELNLIEKGKNYGWPASQGDTVRAGTVGPVRHSGATSTWAPSGLAFAHGRLFFAGLGGATLYEAGIGADGTVTAFSSHLEGDYGRLRAVVVGPDGALYVTTSNRDGRGTPRAGDDKILRIRPEFFASTP